MLYKPHPESTASRSEISTAFQGDVAINEPQSPHTVSMAPTTRLLPRYKKDLLKFEILGYVYTSQLIVSLAATCGTGELQPIKNGNARFSLVHQSQFNHSSTETNQLQAATRAQPMRNKYRFSFLFLIG